jgi:flavin reductase (DIM6/NTAB) family NADH-FMN oxidoreductase RutF
MSAEKTDKTSFDSRAYRDALGCFATGVCLIATEDEDGHARAITANSFSSVSLRPPMILWCIDESSDRFDLYMKAERFSVNMLKADQADLSTHFAKDVEAALTGDQLARGSSAVPVFADALGHIVCRTAWRQKAGDHVVIFGAVESFHSSEGDALGFFKGSYANINAGKS